MITKEEAKKLVKIEINQWKSQEEIVIYDEHTIEFDYGWTFFYNHKNFKKDGGLVGNSPLLVNKFTSKMISIGSSERAEHFIDQYEGKMRGKEKIWSIRLKEKIRFSKYFKFYKLNKNTLRFSKEIWKILNSFPNIIREGNFKEIRYLKYDLNNAGIKVILEKNGKIDHRLSDLD